MGIKETIRAGRTNQISAADLNTLGKAHNRRGAGAGLVFRRTTGGGEEYAMQYPIPDPTNEPSGSVLTWNGRELEWSTP